MPAEPFMGFRGGMRATVIPNAFFTAVLPQIEDQAELLVTLYAFFALGQRSDLPRTISQASLLAEPPLLKALTALPGGAEVAFSRGLALALQRGTLILMGQRADGDATFALNTDASRRVAAERGVLAGPLTLMTPDITVPLERSSAFGMYEENIGSVPPLLMDELDDAERLYPHSWIEAAFHEAIANNRRSWRYISRILERWKLEGPDYGTSRRPTSGGTGSRRRTVGGPYRRVVDREQPDRE
jgi:DNA replication protein